MPCEKFFCNFCQIIMNNALCIVNYFVTLHPLNQNGRLDERLSQRSAKPSTPVRIGYRPHKKKIQGTVSFLFFGILVLRMIAHKTNSDTICRNMCLHPKWVSANHEIRTECLCWYRQVLRVPHQQFQSLPLEELRWSLHRLLC